MKLKTFFRIAVLMIKGKIKPSIILVNNFNFQGGGIGWLNIIIANSLTMEEGSRIGKFNLVHGGFDLIMHKRSWLEAHNRITDGNYVVGGERSKLELGEGVHIVVNHSFNMTGSIVLGNNTTIAGCGSYFWTHSFLKIHSDQGIARVDGNITIGENVYIAANNVICPGVHITDNVMTGAGTVVSKNLTKSGLYVSSSMRYIDFNADRDIDKYGKPVDRINNCNIYKKF